MNTNDFNVKYKSIIEKYADILINKMIESDTTKLIETENSIYRIRLLNKEENIYETN